MGAYDSFSASYQLLIQMSETKRMIEFKGKIFLPVLRPSNETWGFIEINPVVEKPTPAQIRKAVQAIKDLIETELAKEESLYIDKGSENYSMLVLESDLEKGHRMSSNIFYNEKYTSFINLSEWINQDDTFSLKSLREFSGSLLFVPEVLDLTTVQRSVIALYSLLPDGLKGSSMIICSKSSYSDLKESLKSEKGFLSAFADRKSSLHDFAEKNRSY